MRSVELKDWLNCGEPRSVRRVMRTVKEDLEAAEIQVQALYEEGARKERSSDSSRRTYHSNSVLGAHSHHRRALSSGGGAGASLSGAPPRVNLSKLWCDRIEIFAPVNADKLSIMTGIIKIALKVAKHLKLFSMFVHNLIILATKLLYRKDSELTLN